MNSTAEINQIIPPQFDEKDDDQVYNFAKQLANFTVMPMILKSAVELDLLEMIAKAGPGAYVSPSQLAAQLPSSQPETPAMLDRMLGLLSTYSVLNCKLGDSPHGGVECLYSLGPVCKFLTKNSDGGGSLASLFIMSLDKIFIEIWYHLKDCVLNGGKPFVKAYGMSPYEYHDKDPRLNKVFNEAMSGHSTIVMKKILQTYKGFEGLNTVVDVGGGTGATTHMITSQYPNIKAINFDLPHVLKDAPSYPGVEHVGGDMFASLPSADAIFMRLICHGWSDEDYLKLLKNCYKALPDNGKVILVESIHPEVPDTKLETKNIYALDATMMLLSSGKERREREFEALGKNAGFKLFNKACRAYDIWVMGVARISSDRGQKIININYKFNFKITGVKMKYSTTNLFF